MHCAKHGTAKESHPFYHDKGIYCAECAAERERRANARRQQPEQYSKWLVEAANFLAEHNDWFACDCDAYQESDTGAWIHQEEKCASFWEDHLDIMLREVAERIALDAEEIKRLRNAIEAEAARRAYAAGLGASEWRAFLWEEAR